MPLLSVPTNDPTPHLDLQGRRVFLSASIPDPSRWNGPFDAFAITDAVVALARALFTAHGGLVTAAHPTIAPLILYVARELPEFRERDPSVLVYQSRLFEDVLPAETEELAAGGLAELRWTAAAPNEEPQPGRWDRSLELLRAQMLDETDPVAAIFVGGMDGILQEFEFFRRRYAERPTYALTRPGGAASGLVNNSPETLAAALDSSSNYASLMRRVIEDIANRNQSV